MGFIVGILSTGKTMQFGIIFIKLIMLGNSIDYAKIIHPLK